MLRKLRISRSFKNSRKKPESMFRNFGSRPRRGSIHSERGGNFDLKIHQKTRAVSSSFSTRLSRISVRYSAAVPGLR